jgi:hypothetical protein
MLGDAEISFNQCPENQSRWFPAYAGMTFKGVGLTIDI